MTALPSFNKNYHVVSHDDVLLAALFLAAVVHAIIIIGINFSSEKQDQVTRSIQITIANTPVKKAPKSASFLAQDNQIGAGEKKSKPEAQKQQLPSIGRSPDKLPQLKPVTRPKHAPKQILATVAHSEVKVVTTKEPDKNVKDNNIPMLTAEALHQQIAQLGEQIRKKHESMDLSKIKHLNAVSTHKYVAAQYMRDWEKKVEKTGNLNYPEVARKKNFYGALTMEVGIDANGRVYSIRIKQSSGNTALDDAAKRIVKMSEPFPPLPKELLKELDVLVITRVWKFSDESGMSTR